MTENSPTEDVTVSSEATRSLTGTARQSDGHECSFVSEVPEDCRCAICTKVLQEPYLTECCGQNYCKSCIQQWLQRNRSHSCPNCRAIEFKYMQDKRAERMIKELEVACAYEKEGCTWTGCLSDLEWHLISVDGCVYAREECPNGCGEVIVKNTMNGHVDTECRLRKTACTYCNQIGTAEFLTSQHINTCAEYPIVCPNGCGKTILRKDLEAHSENDCEVKCPFYEVGCPTVLRCGELDGHVASSQGLHLVKAVQHFRAEMDSLRAQLEEGEREKGEMKEELVSIREENRGMKQVMEETQASVAVTWKNLQFLTQRSNAVSKAITAEIDFLPSMQAAEAIALECIKTQLCPVHLQRESGLPATVRMSSYSQYKETGQVWYTPPFFICNGYKVCLAVHPNGVGAGKRTHVSIYLHQMAGEFDSELKWPYHVSDLLEVRLMRQVEGSTDGKRSSSPKRWHTSSRGEMPAKDLKSSHKNSSPGFMRRKPHLEEASIATLVEECQHMHVTSLLHQITRPQLVVGPPVGKVELFCLQRKAEAAVYYDSLVFQLSMKSADMTRSLTSEMLDSRGFPGCTISINTSS